MELTQLKAVKHQLDRLNIGRFPHSLSMKLGMPYYLSPDEFRTLDHQTQLIEAFFKTCFEIYKTILITNEFPHIRKLFEANLPLAHRELNRLSFLNYNIHSPVIYRADFISFQKLAEIELQGVSLHFAHALLNAFENKDLLAPSPVTDALASAIKNYTHKDRPKLLYLLPDKAYDNDSNPLTVKKKEWDYLGEIFKANYHIVIDTLAYSKLINLNPNQHGYDFIYCTGTPLLFNYHINKLFADVIPDISFINVSKIQYLLPFLPETKNFFSDEIRELFPYSSLFTEAELIKVQKMTVKEKNNWVLKYAGMSPFQYWGAKNVFLLRHSKKREHTVFEELIKSKEPWMLQERIVYKTKTTYLEGEAIKEENNLSVRINPFYVRLPNFKLKLLGGFIMYSKDWKCHGGENTIIAPLIFPLTDREKNKNAPL